MTQDAEGADVSTITVTVCRLRARLCIGQKVSGSKPGIHVHECTLVDDGAFMTVHELSALRCMQVHEGT